MGGFIAKQPNGLYCRFSTVVDTVTDWNMTEEQYIDMCVQKAIKEAREDAIDTLKRWQRPFSEVKQRFQPGNHSIERFNEILQEMGDEGLTQEQIEYLKHMHDDEQV
jgi:hypothetical protein